MFSGLLLGLAALTAAIPTSADMEEYQQKFDLIRRQIPVKPCSTGVHVIAASGDGQNNVGGYGLIGSLSLSVLKAIPDSTNVTLPYPKGDPNGIYSTTVGAKNMLRYIQDYYAYCPKTRIALMGYSAGAIVMMNTLCGASQSPWQNTAPLPSNWTKAVIAGVAYGDETSQANQPFNKGTCETYGRWPRTKGCGAWAPYLQAYCDFGDPQCCNGGFAPPVHFAYPGKYDGNATRFYTRRYRATGGKNKVSPPPRA